MYRETPQDTPTQGDIYDNCPSVAIGAPIEGEYNTATASVEKKRVIIITHSCEYEKPQSTYVLVATVRPLSDFNPEQYDSIRNNQVYNLYWLSVHPSMSVEQCVDLRTIRRVHKRLFDPIASKLDKLVSLTKVSRLALQDQISQFFGRIEKEEF